MNETVTYLEMTDPAELRPAAPVPGLALERIDGTSALVRAVLTRVGEPYGWTSGSRTETEWAEWLAPAREYWLIKLGAETAGIAVMARQDDGDVQIASFGLLPEFVGRGAGGYALTLVLRRAWLAGADTEGPVRRVWLHTSSRDHPHAMTNYRRRGLRPYQTEIKPS